jgi:FlaA1/EpsC-like NDP-sugar epimerase
MNAGNEIDDFFRDRRVMVTGACGTVGRALLTRLEQSPAQRVLGLDHAESAVFELGRRFNDARVSVRLGDVGQREPLIERFRDFRDVDVVLHTAAYKPGAVQGQ